MTTLSPSAINYTELAHEDSRTYTFPGGDKITVDNVSHLCVRPSGNHRLKTKDGRLVIVAGGWLSLDVKAPDFEV